MQNHGFIERRCKSCVTVQSKQPVHLLFATCRIEAERNVNKPASRASIRSIVSMLKDAALRRSIEAAAAADTTAELLLLLPNQFNLLLRYDAI